MTKNRMSSSLKSTAIETNWNGSEKKSNIERTIGRILNSLYGASWKTRGDGERRQGMGRGGRIDTTLGEQVTALTDEMVELVPDEKLVHTFVAYVLADVLNNWRAISNTWH